MATVGKSLPEMINKITNLILATRGSNRKKLQEQQAQLAKKLQKLIDKNVPQDTEEYKKLISEIKKANGQIKAAIDDIKNVAETIETIGKVIGMLSKVAAMAV